MIAEGFQNVKRTQQQERATTWVSMFVRIPDKCIVSHVVARRALILYWTYIRARLIMAGLVIAQQTSGHVVYLQSKWRMETIFLLYVTSN